MSLFRYWVPLDKVVCYSESKFSISMNLIPKCFILLCTLVDVTAVSLEHSLQVCRDTVDLCVWISCPALLLGSCISSEQIPGIFCVWVLTICRLTWLCFLFHFFTFLAYLLDRASVELTGDTDTLVFFQKDGKCSAFITVKLTWGFFIDLFQQVEEAEGVPSC